MICDHHAYYDEEYFSITEYKKLLVKNKINNAILSPPCTYGKEPKKSETMYTIQRKLLISDLGYSISRLVSKSFYNDQNELKLFWKFFSGNKDLKKIICPTNNILYKQILKEENLKMWYWINPNNNNTLNDYDKEIKKMKGKIFGLKFHMYWHNFKIDEILKYHQLANYYKLPIYIILNYVDEKDLNNFLTLNKFQKILFGYGGFPMFNKCWKKIVKYENCFIDLASNHIDIKIIKKIFNIFPVNKIIFSSDCPYNFEDKNMIFDYNIFNKRIISINPNKFNTILENKL